MYPFHIVIVINQASVNFPAIGPGYFNSSKHEFPSVECGTIGDYCVSLVYMHKFV